ncbi:hypothetical protein L4174_008885 [Photobacterium sp. CCB-ST2H9]|uniref:hypothetical protein n=1 Tax=Photobacterium sp. CCB-ST2H9 TaxID=2912855 RepID=UPI00200343BF|nr:hypothetical protein [Photobacterium sp. CCB-ST2H9]UTM55971.1 hypothetical protein L4174_008885 [Photobacterium sp. CCB-ST2H9]
MSENHSMFSEQLLNTAFEDLVQDLEKELGISLSEEEKKLAKNLLTSGKGFQEIVAAIRALRTQRLIKDSMKQRSPII